MKYWFIQAIIVFLAFSGSHQTCAIEERRVLFVGNSLTHRIRERDLPIVVPNAEVTINPHFHTFCGHGLQDILENPKETCGELKAPYTGGSIYDALRGEPWSAIVFQPFNRNAHIELEAIKTMIEVHRCEYPENQPSIYLYATWPGRPDARTHGFRSLWERPTFTPESNFVRNRNSFHWIYHRLRKDYFNWDVNYIGVGDMLAEIEGCMEKGALPTLGSIRAIFADDIHHGNMGHWIAAQAMIAAILGIDPNQFNDAKGYYNVASPSYGMRVLDLPVAERAAIKSVIRESLESGPHDDLLNFTPDFSKVVGEVKIHLPIPYDVNVDVEKSKDLASWEVLKRFVGSEVDTVSFLSSEDEAFFRVAMPNDEEVHYYQPVASKASKLRCEYNAADLNHVIVAGQSNAVGYNGLKGHPISVNQPYDNLMFGSLPISHYYATTDIASSAADASILNHKSTLGSGLRAPNNMKLTVDVDGRRFFWGPGGKTTPTWQFERYREALKDVGLQPLREGFDQEGEHSESFASTVCNALTRRTGARFLGSVSGIGGASLNLLNAREFTGPEGYPYRYTVDLASFSAELEGYYGSGPFAQTLAQVERAKELAREQGLSYKVAAVVWVQGESDNSNTNYANALSTMVNHYNTCIKAITGQEEDIFFFADTITYNKSYAGRSDILEVDQQLQIAHDNESNSNNSGRVFLVGPRYPYNFNTHYAPQNIVAKGEVIAQAIERILFRRRPWEALSIRSVAVQNNNLDCQFYVPLPPLQWGITQANSVEKLLNNSFSVNYGFTVSSASGEDILMEVSLVSPSKVRLTCSEGPKGGTLTYGNQVLNSGASLRGNLCDSHDFPSLLADEVGKSYDTRNWCMPFVLQL